MSNAKILNHPKLSSLKRVIARIELSNGPEVAKHIEGRPDDGLNEFKEDLETFAQSAEPAVLLHELMSLFEDGCLTIEARGNTLILAESQLFVLTIAALEGNGSNPSTILDSGAADMLSSHPSSSIVVNLGVEPIDLNLHPIPQEWLRGMIDREARIEGKPISATLPKGKALYLDARTYIPDLQYSDKVTLVARVSSKRYQPLACSVSRSTGQFRMYSCTVPAIARIPLAMKLLCELIGDDGAHGSATYEDSLSIFERYCGHRLHFFRWTAIQSLAAIDLRRSKPYILAAASDTHPHVRRAAKAAIRMLELEV